MLQFKELYQTEQLNKKGIPMSTEITREIDFIQKNLCFGNSRILSYKIKQSYKDIIKTATPIFINIVNQYGTRNTNHGFYFHMFSDQYMLIELLNTLLTELHNQTNQIYIIKIFNIMYLVIKYRIESMKKHIQDDQFNNTKQISHNITYTKTQKHAKWSNELIDIFNQQNLKIRDRYSELKLQDKSIINYLDIATQKFNILELECQAALYNK